MAIVQPQADVRFGEFTNRTNREQGGTLFTASYALFRSASLLGRLSSLDGKYNNEYYE
jgi:hypothetical protein